MRKLTTIVLLAFMVIACNEEPKTDYAVLHGKIDNKTTNELILYSNIDQGFKKVIDLNEDGSFRDTLRTVMGGFTLVNDKKYTNIYLDKGDNINVVFDYNDFDNSLSFSGDGVEITNYIQSKIKKSKDLLGEGTSVYLLEEPDYKAKMNDVKNSTNEILDAAQGISEDYKTKEKRNINYAYLNKLYIYKSYHSHYAKKPDFEVSEGFLNELNGIDYSSEEDFTFSQDYKSLVVSHYYDKVGELTKKDSTIANDIAFLKVVGDIENETIKNTLLFNNAVNSITWTNNLEDFYNTFISASTNDEHKKTITESYNKLKKTSKGSPSPKFTDYENHAGGTTSLDDLKGKYVYIDVWATWCGPCIAEIPSLKKVEKEYHGKNIAFVSISIDTKNDYEKWKNMVTDKELGGIQVIADNDWSSTFVQDYSIKGIPKFILLDPNGNIVDANAPRPSDPKLVELFNKLKI